MQFFFRISIIFIGFLLIFITFWLINSSYDELSSSFLGAIGRIELKKQFEQAFSLSKFSFLKVFLVIFTIFYSIIEFFLYKNTQFIIENIKKGSIILKNDIQYFVINTGKISRKQSYSLFLVLFLAIVKSIYFGATIPISYDEAWTYNYFSSQFPLLAACYYPAANNHVLFSIVSAFFEKLPFFSPVFLIRLPSILACFAAFFVFFGTVKQWFGTRFGLFSLVFFTSIYGVVLYSWLARGYAFQLLFTCINLHFFLKIIANDTQNNTENHRIKNLFYYGFSLFLGLYTVPSFLYYWLAMSVIYFILKIKEIKNGSKLNQNRRQFFGFMIANTLVFIAILIAFTPIFISSDLKIAFQHSNFPIGNNVLGAFRYVFNDIFSYFTSKNIFIAIFFVFLIISSLFLVIFKEKNDLNRKIIVISLFFVGLPFLFFILQQAYLPSRIFIFCLPFVAILLAYPFAKYKASVSGVLPLFLVLFLMQALDYDASYDGDSAKLGEKLVDLQAANIYTHEANCKPIILFCFRKNRLPMPNIVCSETQEKPSDDTRFFILKNDSIIGKNDLLKPVFKLKYFSLYEKTK